MAHVVVVFCWLCLTAFSTVLTNTPEDDQKLLESEYEIFFNRGYKQSQKTTPIGGKSKVDVLGSVLKKHVASLRKTVNKQVELVFLVDSSASVGSENFFNELKFVKKLLADFTVAYNATRVAVITFSSRNRVIRHIDHITKPSVENHKCILLEKQLPKITYSGGGTYTLGAMLQAQDVLKYARETATKAVFLVTDGYSNGGDPRPAAKLLRDQGVRIFTFGIQNGNVRELYDMASEPPEEHSYILDSFEEFEALARRALHEDLHTGSYLHQDEEACSQLCDDKTSCCETEATCTCGTHTGYYACLCKEGHYGTGLKGDCHPCPAGTYWNGTGPGDISSCLQCPDPNHYSEPGSIDIKQCRCKLGYKEINKQCVVLQCPVLKPPEHGFFVNENCDNVYNAACGARCEPGYKLRGSSIRLCGENGTWTGQEAFCELKACPALSAPRHGSVSCNSENYVFESICEFSCDPGYTLIGSKQRTCLAIALWDGLPALCRPIKCPPLQPIANGIVTPAKCIKGKSSYGDVCLFDCNIGYHLQGGKEKKCTDAGKWNPENSTPRCEDVQPPSIKCPENIVMDSEENEASALVNWETPAAVDNSGETPIIAVVPAIIPPKRFHIGVFTVTYIAEDKNRNRRQCNFTVTVRDIQPPMVDKCISPPVFLSREIPVEVVWEEPIFSDNSGSHVSVRRSHEPGFFPLGETQVTYEARDEAGNNNTCVITVTVQEHACAFPPDPVNGNANCTEGARGVYCSLSCKDGYAFAIRPPTVYFCAYDGVWMPKEHVPFPDCSATELSNSLYQTGVVSVIADGLNCDNYFLLNQVEHHLQHKISYKVSSVCSDDITCSVDRVNVDCDQTADETEEKYNIISRKRRAITYTNAERTHKKERTLPNPDEISLVTAYPAEVENQKDTIAKAIFQTERKQTNNNRTGKHTSSEFKEMEGPFNLVLDTKLVNGSHNSYAEFTDGESKIIEVEFELAGNRNSHSDVHDALPQQELLNRVQNAMDVLEEAAKKGELDISLGSKHVKIKNLRFKRSQPKFVCEPGYVAEGNKCIKCPVGTYFNVLSELCDGCPMGTYQFQEGQLSCLVCPERTSTISNQSKSVGECRAQCLPGSFSPTGLEVCETCPRGYFQPLYAQTSCIQCPSSTTTWRRGARRDEECQDPCSPGHVSKTGLAPCFACPIGYFQPVSGGKACYRCPNSAFTVGQGSTSVNDCAGMKHTTKDGKLTIPSNDLLPVNDCFSVPCLNGATCKALDFGFLCYCIPGYTGIYCETEIDECENFPCQNNGTCIDFLNGFTCNCQPGFTGNLCQKDIDECAYEPCLNGGSCTDEINKFSCECVEGFVGPVCQYNIDDCLSAPCLNGATCEDLIASYKCRCLQGFTGDNCETNIDDCASNPCKNNASCTDGIEDFICHCLPGYKGRLCKEDVNECQSDPCMNGATCLDKLAHFTCLCPPSFTGDLCETELPQDFFLAFPSSGTLDFVQVDGLIKPLTQLTVCMWMKTTDKANYGTPLSYANETADNLLTLTDYNGFVFYINMQEEVTDVTANDGRWHHICVTWSSEMGAWSIYKDGEQADKGTGLAKGTLIPADGSLILGQEQDSKGSGFSAAESFIGSLSLLHIWDYVLTQGEISQLTTSCSTYIGNVKAWSDFLGGIRGRVEKGPSDFCGGCEDPQSPDHGDVTVSGVKSNALATYSCHSGYTVEGSSTRKCMVYGDWSGERPGCSRISCGFPGYLSNGYVNGRKYLYNDIIYYSCAPGYHLIGMESRTCQADGTWSGSPPSCEEILCAPPAILGNGKVTTSVQKFKPGHKIHFQCNEGYRLDGSPSLLCGSDGQWNQTQPVCQPKSCESPPRVIHGYVIGKWEKFDVGSVVQYRCDDGYVLNGSSEIRCALKNRWEGSIPRCEKVNCGVPPTVNNAVVQGKDFRFGGNVTYQCDHGYEISTANQLTCQSNGLWSSPLPQCDPVKCPHLSSLENGYVEVTDYTYSNVAKYHCNTGYELQGIRYRKCRASRDWSGEEPTCVPVTCSQPESIPNGKFIGNDWTVGNTVSYTCHPGYMLMGQADRVCLETGHWLHNTPSCEPIECRPPDAVQHARIHGKDYHFGQRVRYQCETGYQLIGKAVRVCLEDRRWGPEPPICRPVYCGPPVQVENGEVVATNYTYTGRASYRCHLGFRLEGSQIRDCLADGKWSGEDPSCTIIECSKPSQVQHAYIIFSDARYGSVVEYYCDEGYKLEGSVQRICREDGYWDGDEPSCQIIHCSFPSNTEFADVDVPDTKFGSVITYSCHYGYEIDGPVNRTCQQDETWSGKDPRCLPIYCPSEELQLPNGNVILESNLMGSAVVYACNTGYELVGQASQTCLQSRQWEGVPPECRKVSCPPPMPPLNGEVVWKDHSFGEIITYSCHKGYIMHGDVNRTCLPDGTWSKTEPQCIPITCSKPENIEFGYVRYDSLSYRSKVKYSCHNGYKLIGPKFMECRANQTWSGTTPKCIQILCPEPPSIMYGHHITRNFTIGSKATYVCDYGFNLQSSELLCDLNGNWVGNLPSCNIVKCETPPSLRFGKIIGNNYTFGSIISFVCNSGWELIGEKHVYCEASGFWNASYPSCIGTFCHSPEQIDHGEIAVSNLKYGTTIIYKCHFGYQLIGDVSRSCQIDNTWSGKPPKCLPIPCKQPKEIKYGSRIGDKFEYGSNVTYICNHGYMLHGAAVIHCLENGTWSSPEPMCVEVSCLIPELIANGEVVVPVRPRLLHDEGMQGDDSLLNAAQRGDITISRNMVVEKSQSDIFRLGARVIYKCNKGYYLEGERMRSCMQNGQWSGVAPQCIAISCGNVDEIKNGNYNVSTKTFLSYVNYSCNIGYRLEGPNTRMCLSNGTWSGTTPHCIPIKCPQPPPITHGKVKWDFLSYGGIARYECFPGYRLLGNLSRTCQQEENWSGSEPICQELACEKPDVLANGWVQIESLKVGGTARYGCNEGYELFGIAVRTCLMNETWNSHAPSCNVISCFPPRKIKHGEIVGKNFTFGATVTYKCHSGYKLEGSSHQTCLANKTWSDVSPYCHPLNCSMPLSPKHGTVHISALTVGSYADYTCHEGYELFPNNSRACLSNLTWSGEEPFCQPVYCPSITKLPHGSVKYSTFIFGSTLEFTCHQNYKLEGAKKVWCLQNKEWSFPVPECRRHLCDLPKSPKFSVINPKGPHVVGDIIRYSCIIGYKLHGNNIQKCNQEGHWEGILPTCSLIDCGTPPVIANGKTAYFSDTKYMSQVTYMCNDGYELQGDNTLLCESNGFWVGKHPNCIAVLCGSPPTVPHSVYQVDHLPGISTVFYYCDHGYKLVGSKKHICKDGKEWNIGNTYCEKVQCRDPPSVQYSTVQHNLFDIGSVALYTCSPGYYRVDDTVNLRCSPDGHWVGELPRCLPISCSPPPALKNGIIEGRNYTFQSTITYQCNKGYHLNGKRERSCQANGQWSSDDPQCYPITCPEIEPPPNSFIWKEKQFRQPLIGDRVGFTCKDGYTLIGSENIECDEDGLWHPDVPYCKAVTCNPPTTYPLHAVVIKQMEVFSFGDHYSFVCEPGYRPDGDLTIKCLQDGSWSKTEGRCIKVSCGRPRANNGAVVLGISYKYLDKVVVRCPPGTVTAENTVLTCMGDGKWNDEASCQAFCSHHCLNGGVCIRPGVCKCPSGYFGEVCQHAICILPCLHGGKCTGPYKCSCLQGYTGSRCEAAICQPHCQNRGICIAPNLCRCRISYSGSHCQYQYKPKYQKR